MLYVIHVEQFNDGHDEERALFAYETMDEALSKMYGWMQAAIDTPNVAMAMNGIVNDGGHIIRMERWEEAKEPEPVEDEVTP